MRRILASLAISVFGILLLPQITHALAVPAPPTDIPIVDQTNTLTDAQKQSLTTKIQKEREETGNQIAILIVSTLDNEPIESYSLKVARGWGIGQKERNSGALLLIAKDDRKLRIEVGYGLEGALTDIRSAQIIRDRITPEFKQDKYYEGVDLGLDGIISAIHGEVDPKLNSPRKISDGVLSLLCFGFFCLIWLGSILARTKSWWAGGVLGGIIGIIISATVGLIFAGLFWIIGLVLFGLLFDFLVSKNYRQAVSRGTTPSWWAGGTHLGGGGGSSGGFGGFGGGSFGGGGSSGSW